MHTAKYWDSKLYQIQKLADSINYHIASIKKQVCARRNSATFLQCGRAGAKCKKL